MVDEKEEEREELDMNCGGITPTSLGSMTIDISLLVTSYFFFLVFSCTAKKG